MWQPTTANKLEGLRGFHLTNQRTENSDPGFFLCSSSYDFRLNEMPQGFSPKHSCYPGVSPWVIPLANIPKAAWCQPTGSNKETATQGPPEDLTWLNNYFQVTERQVLFKKSPKNKDHIKNVHIYLDIRTVCRYFCYRGITTHVPHVQSPNYPPPIIFRFPLFWQKLTDSSDCWVFLCCAIAILH